MPFHEELGIESGEGFDVHVVELLSEDGPAESIGDAVHQFVADIGGGACDEGESGDVSCESNAAGDDDIGFRAISAEPFAAGGGELVDPNLVLIRTR